MLQTDEARTGKINIPDIDARTMTRMIHYIYTGILTFLLGEGHDEEDFNKIIYAAEKYQMPKMKTLAYFELAKQLDMAKHSDFDLAKHFDFGMPPQQVAEMLIIGEEYGSGELQEFAIQMIRASRRILEDQEFESKLRNHVKSVDILFKILQSL